MSRKTVRHINAPYGKEFGDIFYSLAQRHGREEVWRDFITMSACSISNAVDKRFYDQREKMYMDAVKRYTSEEAKQIAEMFALVVMSLTQPFRHLHCTMNGRGNSLHLITWAHLWLQSISSLQRISLIIRIL